MIQYNSRNRMLPRRANGRELGTTIMEIEMQGHATTRVERACLRCEAKFSVKPSKAERGRGLYCSRPCAYPPRVQALCAQCGASFSKPPSQAHGKTSLFCSRACMGASLRVLPEQRLMQHVDHSGGADDCWPWTGLRNHAGYGKFEHLGRSYGAHRVAWEIANGRPVPDGLLIRHVVCDNPPCCNPAHLAPGTSQNNSDDALAAGRVPRGASSPRAVLTEAIVIEIRQRHAAGESTSRIARSLHVARGTISNVVLRRTWKHLAGDRGVTPSRAYLDREARP